MEYSELKNGTYELRYGLSSPPVGDRKPTRVKVRCYQVRGVFWLDALEPATLTAQWQIEPDGRFVRVNGLDRQLEQYLTVANLFEWVVPDPPPPAPSPKSVPPKAEISPGETYCFVDRDHPPSYRRVLCHWNEGSKVFVLEALDTPGAPDMWSFDPASKTVLYHIDGNIFIGTVSRSFTLADLVKY